MKKIHPTQEKLLEILKKNSNNPLTIRELQDLLNLSSTSVVFHHIQQLEKKGLLIRNPSNPGDYQIVSDVTNNLVYLNLYGLAQCGPNGRILDGEPVDRIPFSTKMFNFSTNNAFLVRATGDSMVPKINEGDLVVVIKNNEINNGDLVVCVNDNKALIKKINKLNDKIFLMSYNENYPSFEASKEMFHVEGIVKSVLSNF